MQDLFNKWARAISSKMGSSFSFATALSLVLIWAGTGPLFDFSETWQLVINTSTTIITFLMVFLIQNTQNRDSLAVQIKLDELIRALHDARNKIIDIEKLSDEELLKYSQEFERLKRTAEENEPLNPNSP